MIYNISQTLSCCTTHLSSSTYTNLTRLTLHIPLSSFYASHSIKIQPV